MHHALQPPAAQLLSEVEDLLRTMPNHGVDANDADGFAWMGRAEAVMDTVNGPLENALFAQWLRDFSHTSALAAERGLRDVRVALHKAQYKLRIQTASTGTTTKVLAKGEVFDYFDEVRKIVEKARTDLFFVDPYLDVDFVSRYLPQVKLGTSVRLLGQHDINSLIPAVDLIRKQRQLKVELRHAQSFHDRWVFVDGAECYYSGTSFSAGAKKAPTLLAPLTDGLAPVKATYEALWTQATVKQ